MKRINGNTLPDAAAMQWVKDRAVAVHEAMAAFVQCEHAYRHNPAMEHALHDALVTAALKLKDAVDEMQASEPHPFGFGGLLSQIVHAAERKVGDL